MRSDIGKGNGVRTLVEGGGGTDLEIGGAGEMETGSLSDKKDSAGSLTRGTGWDNDSASKLNDGSSEELGNWGLEIRKTTVSTQTIQ